MDDEYYNLDDHELWQILKDGSKQGLESLFYRYHADLFRYAVKFCGSRQIAEDHIQGLFLKIWNRRNYLSDVVSVKTYLWTALRRSIIARNKERAREKEAFTNYSRLYENVNFSIEDVIIKKEGGEEVVQLLHKAINKLNARQKEVLFLKYFEGLSYDEIEQVTGLNYQTLRNYIYVSIKVLKEVLAKKNYDFSQSAINTLLLAMAAFGSHF